MNSEASLVFAVWESVREFIPASKRTDVAISMFRSFEEFGLEQNDFVLITDEDDNLQAAYKAIFGADEEVEEDYDPYE